MGMFDEIIVPKSYLKGLLKKKDEKLLNANHTFQTKDLDNVMDLYKIYRQRLHKLDRNNKTKKYKWAIVNDNVDINFYDYVKDKKGDAYSIEFEFIFKNGRLDKKSLVSLKLETTKKQRDSIDKMWDTEQEIFNFYRENSIKYRMFSFLEKILQKTTNWARRRHQLPLSLRKEAYEKSGRLKKDPKALDAYMDI
jgi:hypothetical protein